MKNEAKIITIEEQLEKPKGFVNRARDLYRDKIEALDKYNDSLERLSFNSHNNCSKQELHDVAVRVRYLAATEQRYGVMDYLELIYALNDKIKRAEARISELEKGVNK